MKKISYGQILDTNYQGAEETEFLISGDWISSRAINRVTNNLQSNIEENYNILQQVIKATYGNKPGILPDVYEEFDPRNIVVNQIQLGQSWWLNIPTGIAFLRTKEEGYDESRVQIIPNLGQDNNAGKDTGNPFSFRTTNLNTNFYLENDKVSSNWNDTLRETNFQKDQWHSYSISNKPNVELMERQLAKMINLDVTDNENDIKIGLKYVRRTNDDNPDSPWEARYNISITENRNNTINKWFYPQTPINTYWVLNNIRNSNIADFNLIIGLQKENNIIESFTIKVVNGETIEQIKTDVITYINGNSKYLEATEAENNEIKVSFKENDPKYNVFKLNIRTDSAGSSSFLNGNFGTSNTGTTQSGSAFVIPVDSVNGNCIEQGYYTNIFDMINIFLTDFRGNLVTIQNIGNYLNLVPIISLKNVGLIGKNTTHTRIVYYNKDLVEYNGTENFRELDKSFRFGITKDSNNIVPVGAIPLYEVNFKIDANDFITLDTSIGKEPKCFYELYDRRSIHTKHIFTNLIRSDTRTELVNWLHYKDRENDPIREIRITGGNKDLVGRDSTENSYDNKKLQMKFISPVIEMRDERDEFDLEEGETGNHQTNNGYNFIRLQKDTKNVPLPYNFLRESTTDWPIGWPGDSKINIIAEKNGAKINLRLEKDTVAERFNIKGRMFIESSKEDQIEIKSNAIDNANDDQAGQDSSLLVKTTELSNWSPKDYNNIYFSNTTRKRVAKLRIDPDGSFVLQNNIDATTTIPGIQKDSRYSTSAATLHNDKFGNDPSVTVNNLNPNNLALRIESDSVANANEHGTYKNIITFGSLKSVNTAESVGNWQLAYFNRSKNSYDIGGDFYSINENKDDNNRVLAYRDKITGINDPNAIQITINKNRYRNLSVRNAWIDVLNFDGRYSYDVDADKTRLSGIRNAENATNNGEQFTTNQTGPSLSLNLNNSNINNVRAVYFINEETTNRSNSTVPNQNINSLFSNSQSLNFHTGTNVTSKVNTIWSYDGGFAASTHRRMQLQPYYNVTQGLKINQVEIDSGGRDDLTLLRLDKWGVLKLKRSLRVTGYDSSSPTQLQSSLYNDGLLDHQGSVVTKGGLTSLDTNDNYGGKIATIAPTDINAEIRELADADTEVVELKHQYPLSVNGGTDEINEKYRFGGALTLRGGAWIDKTLTIHHSSKINYVGYSQSLLKETTNIIDHSNAALRILRGGAYIENDSRLNGITWFTHGDPNRSNTYNYETGVQRGNSTNHYGSYNGYSYNQYSEIGNVNGGGALRVINGGAYIHKNLTLGPVFDGVWRDENNDVILNMTHNTQYAFKPVDNSATETNKPTPSASIYVLNNLQAGYLHRDAEPTGSIQTKGGIVAEYSHESIDNSNTLGDGYLFLNSHPGYIVDDGFAYKKNDTDNWWWGGNSEHDAATTSEGNSWLRFGTTSNFYYPSTQFRFKNLSLYAKGGAAIGKKLYVGFERADATGTDGPYKNSSYNNENNSSLYVKGPMKVFGTTFGYRSKNAIWNDYADYIEIDENIKEEPGKVYVVGLNGLAKVANKRAQRGSVGICTDTYGYATGEDKNKNQIPIGVSGFVLAYIDKIYIPGTELVSNKNGGLTKANLFEKIFKRECIIGTFYKEEKDSNWNGSKVNNRHWVKI